MKTIDYIPTSKIERATKLVQTGAKVGVNYLKYYGEKIVNSDLTRDKHTCCQPQHPAFRRGSI